MIIGITGLNANDNPGPGVAVIRALREEFGPPLTIIGLSYESLEPGIYLDNVVDKTYQIPYPTAGTSALKDRLEYIHEQEGLDMIIPNYDSELYNFIKIAPWLKSMGIKTFLPTHDQLAARDKVNLSEFGKEFGFSVPADHKVCGTGNCLNYAQVLSAEQLARWQKAQTATDVIEVVTLAEATAAEKNKATTTKR